MDNSVKYKNPSPRLTANAISKLIFWWLVPLFKYGKDNDLEIKDLYNASPKDLSNLLGDNLERNWKRENDESLKMGRKPKLLTAIRKTFLLSYIHYGAWLFFQFVVLRIAQPFILGLLIWHFDPRSESSPGEAYAYATGVVLLAIANALIQHHTNLGQMEIGMRVRIACSSLVYRKILRLSRSAADEIAGGKIINLLSNDVARFDHLFVHLHFVWIMPIQGALVAYLIWRNVHIASLAGIFLITIQTIPLQGYMGKLTSKLRMRVATKTDERVGLMSEIISGIKVIKMYTWEKPFENLVAAARKYEIDVLTLTSYLRGFNKATFVFTERTTLYFTVMAYVLLGNHISASKVFTMAQYFNLMQLMMAIYYPMAVSAGAEALVSISRLESFLLLDENKRSLDIQSQNKNKNIGVTMKNVTVSWNENSIVNTLHDITICVEPGKLCALVGPVGAGKSSLLQVILGELAIREGSVARGGKISYACQETWLFAGSVRNNILFGLPYDEERYRRVTRVCALAKDFVQLPQGDRTLVGERGGSLSGGQRARINLARAVYADADIYLFDDPLSAVDTHVGKQLFDECIIGYLGNKTRILVTHQVHHLKSVDHIIMLNNGVIIQQGTYREFQDSHLSLIKSVTTVDEDEDEEQEITIKGVARTISSQDTSVATSNVEVNEETGEEPRETEELMAKGQMLQSLYWKYFSAGNSLITIIAFFVIMIIGQLGSSGSDYWVAYWTNQEELRFRKSFDNSESLNDSSILDFGNSTDRISAENSTFASDLETSQADLNHTLKKDIFVNSIEILDRDTALWIYGFLIIASVVMTSARNLLFFKICMNSNRTLHDNMFSRLLLAPMRFFDENPSGRILNRFSKDIGSIDEILPSTMLESMQIFCVMIGILGQVVIINWWTIFPMLIMAFFYAKIRNLYLATGRAVKRLEGVGKSPVFSHVNSSLGGLATIRSAGKEELVKREFDSHQDVHTGAYYLSIAASTAFGLWLDAVTITFVAFITYSFVFLDDESTLSGNVGLTISQILILCGMLQHGMRQTAEMVAQMTSVERVLEFTKLEIEGPLISEIGKKPEKTWPSKGEIIFRHVYLRYNANDNPILVDIDIAIEAGMKIGIVGRTGAGKSSLITVLFNLAPHDGEIVIDRVKTRDIGLHDLRNKISIIPQEPVLFASTLRQNLDPFDDYEDADLWSALEQVELKKSLNSLDQTVSKNGTNFSAGQRQLLCLARAILRNNKILVLDEATANVDPNTDRLIQETIRKIFKDCTVLTIAHRLNTVMDSDRVLVMDQGRVVEYDHPHVLLGNVNGFFKRMLDKTGKTMTERLGNISKKAYNDTKSDDPVDT